MLPLVRPVVYVLATFALADNLTAQTPSTPPTAAQDRVQGWLDDLDTLARCLAEKHKNAFFKLKRERFDGTVAEVRAKVPTLRDHEILVEFLKLAALLEDGHTTVRPGGERFVFRSYPINLVWLKDGVFIAAAAEGHKDLIGARLVAVGQVPLDEAARRVAVLSAAENESGRKDQTCRWLIQAEPLAALGLQKDAEQGQFTIVDAAGKQREVVLAPVAAGTRPTYVRGGDGPTKDTLPSRRGQRVRYGMTWLTDGKTLYCWYDSCADLRTKPVAAWCKEVLAAVDDKPPERWVLDLRRNGGGNSILIWPLLAGIKSRPALNQKGRLFVFIGPGTYSSALDNAQQFRRGTNALLVGLPTGGSPNEFGEIKFLALPYSKWQVQYSTKHFKTTNDGATTLAPDLEVDCSAADYFAGRDPVLAAAISYQVEKGR